MLPLLLIYLLHAFYRTQGKGKGDKVLFTFLPFYLFTFNCSQGKGKGIRFFLPFYLFTFINSLAAYPQSSAATSLPAPPGELACIRLALPG